MIYNLVKTPIPNLVDDKILNKIISYKNNSESIYSKKIKDACDNIINYIIDIIKIYYSYIITTIIILILLKLRYNYIKKQKEINNNNNLNLLTNLQKSIINKSPLNNNPLLNNDSYIYNSNNNNNNYYSWN